MRAACLLFAALTTGACAEPKLTSLPTPPSELKSWILVSVPSLEVLLMDSAQPEPVVNLAKEGTLFLLGYHTALAALGRMPGVLPPVGSGESFPLPSSNSVWALGAEPVAMEFEELPNPVRALRLPGLPFEACVAEGRCFAEADHGFCVACPEPPPIAEPLRPEPPRLPPCEDGSWDERYACLFAGEAFAERSDCLGIDAPLGCQVIDPSCAFDRYPAGQRPELWVPGPTPLPNGVVGQPDLDTALSLAPDNAVIHLGAGPHSATRAVPPKVTLAGLCPGETELEGPLLGPELGLARLRWVNPARVAAGSQVTLEDAEVEGSSLAIDGAMIGTRVELRVALNAAGTLLALTSARLHQPLHAVSGAVQLSDVRFLSESGAWLEAGANANFSDTRFETNDLALRLGPGARFEGERMVLRGPVELDTAPSTHQVSLRDTLIQVIPPRIAMGFWAETEPSTEARRGLPCTAGELGPLQLERILIDRPGHNDAPTEDIGLRCNCLELDATDVLVSGFRRGGIYMGVVNGRLERALSTQLRQIDQAQARSLQRKAPGEILGEGIRLARISSAGIAELPFQLALRDISVYRSWRGLTLEGQIPVTLERVQLLGNRATGLRLEQRSAEITIGDLEVGFTSYDGNASSVNGGHGLADYADLNEDGPTFLLERFALHDNEGSGLYLEGTLRPSRLVSGEIAHNRVGIEDLNGRDLSSWLKGVQVFDNQLPFGPDSSGR